MSAKPRSRVLIARFKSECPVCFKLIAPGERMVPIWDTNEFIHSTCFGRWRATHRQRGDE